MERPWLRRVLAVNRTALTFVGAFVFVSVHVDSGPRVELVWLMFAVGIVVGCLERPAKDR